MKNLNKDKRQTALDLGFALSAFHSELPRAVFMSLPDETHSAIEKASKALMELSMTEKERLRRKARRMAENIAVGGR